MNAKFCLVILKLRKNNKFHYSKYLININNVDIEIVSDKVSFCKWF